MKAAVRALRIEAVSGLPEISPGDDLGALLAEAIRRGPGPLEDGDVVVVCHKVVSKAEGRVVRRNEVEVSERARELAARLGKDPVKTELILRESKRVLRAERTAGKPEGLLIVEHRLGFVAANACVDASNAGPFDFVLLPEDPDASARRLADSLGAAFAAETCPIRVGVVIADSLGRPFRLGLVQAAIGVAGVPALVDLRGGSDDDGRPLSATVLAVADELAAAAGLVTGKTGRTPAAVVRGFAWASTHDRARDLVRPEKEDVFRWPV